MTLTEKIQAAEKALGELKTGLVDATNNLEAAPDEASLLAEVEELTLKVEQGEKNLTALQRAEKALAARAAPVEPSGTSGAPAFIKSPMSGDPKDPGDVIFKHAVAQFLAFVERKTVDQVIEERYGNTNYVKATFNAARAMHGLVQKTHVDPAMTSVAGWAEELVRTDTRGFIESIKDVSVAAALAARATSLDFGGFNSIKVPRRNPLGAAGAGVTEPAWVN